MLKKANAVHLHKKNDIQPFEDITKLERMSKTKDSSLFGFISHNKKRPDNLVLGNYGNQMI